MSRKPRASKVPQCVACLASIGWGVKRIMRQVGMPKSTVGRFMRAQRLSDPFISDVRKSAENAKRTDCRQRTERIAARMSCLAAYARSMTPKRSAMDSYYANHEESKRRGRARAIRRYHSLLKGSPKYIRIRLWTRIYCALKRQAKTRRASRNKAMPTMKLIGCSIDQLCAHLEFLFQPGMTWENYGEWHVDHIRPCASFDLSKPEEQMRCFHWSNLQPLWAKDNLAKNDSYTPGEDSL